VCFYKLKFLQVVLFYKFFLTSCYGWGTRKKESIGQARLGSVRLD
jgi:hypothetical protein